MGTRSYSTRWQSSTNRNRAKRNHLPKRSHRNPKVTHPFVLRPPPNPIPRRKDRAPATKTKPALPIGPAAPPESQTPRGVRARDQQRHRNKARKTKGGSKRTVDRSICQAHRSANPADTKGQTDERRPTGMECAFSKDAHPSERRSFETMRGHRAGDVHSGGAPLFERQFPHKRHGSINTAANA